MLTLSLAELEVHFAVVTGFKHVVMITQGCHRNYSTCCHPYVAVATLLLSIVILTLCRHGNYLVHAVIITPMLSLWIFCLFCPALCWHGNYVILMTSLTLFHDDIHVVTIVAIVLGQETIPMVIG